MREMRTSAPQASPDAHLEYVDGGGVLQLFVKIDGYNYRPSCTMPPPAQRFLCVTLLITEINITIYVEFQVNTDLHSYNVKTDNTKRIIITFH